MKRKLSVLTSEPNAPWVRKIEKAFARFEGLDVDVSEEHRCSGSGACSGVIIDSQGVVDKLSTIQLCKDCNARAKLVVADSKPEWEEARAVYRAGATDILEKSKIEETAPQIAEHILRIPRILIVENQPDVSEMWAAHLKEEGYEVETATGEKEAHEKRSQHHFDLLIVDIRLEEDDDELDKSGLRFVEGIPDATPVIIATNHPSPDLVTEAMRLRPEGRRLATEFICKREPTEVLLAKVRELLPLLAPAGPGSDEVERRSRVIGTLYARLAELRGLQREAGGSDLDQELAATFERLRQLQKEEAEAFRASAEDRLLMPLGEGSKIFDKACRLLERP